MHHRLLLTIILLTYGVQPSFPMPPPAFHGRWQRVPDLESPVIRATADLALQMHQYENIGGKTQRLTEIKEAYIQMDSRSRMNYRLVLQVDLYNGYAKYSDKTGILFLQLNTQFETSTYSLTYHFCSGFVSNDKPVTLLNTPLPIDPADPVALHYASLSVPLFNKSYKLDSLLGGSFKNYYDSEFKFVMYKFRLDAVLKDYDFCLPHANKVHGQMFCELALKVDLWTGSINLNSAECNVNKIPFLSLSTQWRSMCPNSTEAVRIINTSVEKYQMQMHVKVLRYSAHNIWSQNLEDSFILRKKESFESGKKYVFALDLEERPNFIKLEFRCEFPKKHQCWFNVNLPSNSTIEVTSMCGKVPKTFPFQVFRFSSHEIK